MSTSRNRNFASNQHTRIFNPDQTKGKNCKASETTKSLELNIDYKLNYKQLTEISVANADRNWHIPESITAPKRA